MGTKQINKMYATDVTSHLVHLFTKTSDLLSPELCKAFILYVYKAHRHKTVCFIKLSHAKCALVEKKISGWVSNFTSLRTLQAEKYAPIGERLCFKYLVCKISAICMEPVEINYTMIY